MQYWWVNQNQTYQHEISVRKRALTPLIVPKRMDLLIRKANITKAQWNEYYAFKVYCLGASPMYYALTKEVVGKGL